MFIAAFVAGPEHVPDRHESRRGSPYPQPEPRPASPGLLAWAREAYRLSRSRRYLAGLDGHMLKDIGLSYAEAEHELNKPFWRC
jgi:uncharacterized protein YjiS (DUF1127 family)